MARGARAARHGASKSTTGSGGVGSIFCAECNDWYHLSGSAGCGYLCSERWFHCSLGFQFSWAAPAVLTVLLLSVQMHLWVGVSLVVSGSGEREPRRRSGIIVACALRLEEHRGTKPAFLIPPAPDRRRGLRGVRGNLKPPPGFPHPWPCWPHHGTDQTNPQTPQPTHPLQRLLDPQAPQPTHPLLAGFLGLSKEGWEKKQNPALHSNRRLGPTCCTEDGPALLNSSKRQ